MPILWRLLEMMGRGLQLKVPGFKDPLLFTNAHKHGGTAKNGSRIRSCFYPATYNLKLEDDQIRSGEHTDTGTVTMVFQHGQGGLEVGHMSNKVTVDLSSIRAHGEKKGGGHPPRRMLEMRQHHPSIKSKLSIEGHDFYRCGLTYC